MTGYTWRGMDTETQDGLAILLATPERFCEPRSWGDVWSFLRDEPIPSYYVGFNLPYDARALLGFLPASVLRVLRHIGVAEHRGWTVELWARRVLRIRKRGDPARVELYDVYPYYGCGLDAAAEKWLKARKKRVPKSWLENMEKALCEHRARVLAYCRYDADLAGRLWGLMVKQYVSLGVDPHRGASPASLALRAYSGSFKHLGAAPWENRIFKDTYYGGRIEVLRRGHFGKVWIYDINSAYPSALATLPDPRKAEMVRVSSGEVRPDVLYGAYSVRVKVPLDRHAPPLPCKSNKLPLVFPVGVWTTWVDRVTLDVLREGEIPFELLDGWEIVSDAERRLLFPDIVTWYRRRREHPESSHALKITLNALYGKTAEEISARVPWKNGETLRGVFDVRGKMVRKIKLPSKHTHFAVAAACTATIRAAIWRAMRLRPGVVIAAATDGLITSRPIPELDGGEEMGAWRLKYRADEAYVVGTGIYAFRLGKKWTERFRGFHVEAGILRKLFRRKDAVTEVRIRHALTLAEAARASTAARMRGNLNRMVTLKKDLNVNFDKKRDWPRPWGSFAEMKKSRPQKSRPWVILD